MNNYKNFLALALLSCASSCVVGMEKNKDGSEQIKKRPSSFAQKIIERIKKEGAEAVVNDVVPGEKIPYLLWASFSDDLSAVKLLLEYGADVKKCHDNISAILYAVEMGHSAVAFELLCHGALGFGKENVKLPLTGPRREVFKLMLDFNLGLRCVEKKTMDFITFKRWFDVLCLSGFHGMAVLIAGDDEKAKKELLSMKKMFDYDRKLKKEVGLILSEKEYAFGYYLSSNLHNFSILHGLIWRRYSKVCECLLREGFSVRIENDPSGKRLLYYAVFYCSLDIVKLFIKYGASDVERPECEVDYLKTGKNDHEKNLSYLSNSSALKLAEARVNHFVENEVSCEEVPMEYRLAYKSMVTALKQYKRKRIIYEYI